MTQTVNVEDFDTVRVLTLNRPDKLNAASLEMQRAVLRAVREVASQEGIRALILTGAGRAFSAGGDRAILRQIAASDCPDEGELGGIAIDTIRAMLSLDIPVIAAVRSFAIGYAAGLVSLCDSVVMGKSAFLSDPHVQYGLAAGPATLLAWPRLCPDLIARDILLSGRQVSADEALRIGLCNHVCNDGDELATALEIARHLASLPAKGLTETKRGLNAPLLAEVERFAQDYGQA